MNYKILDTIVIVRALPEQNLQAGDLGAVVEAYEPDGVEVEFVAASGRTRAVVTLRDADIRRADDSDLMSVRTLDQSA